MPELPEVETVRRGLAPAMAGASFIKTELRRPDLRFPFPQHFKERVEGTTVTLMERRAKYLCAHLSSGDVLIMHLGMSGRFTIDWLDLDYQGCGSTQCPGQFAHGAGQQSVHDHVIFLMSNKARITYNDARRFGFMDLVPVRELESCKHFSAIGIEPLSDALNADYIAKHARGRKIDLKAFLLDQRIIAGLGNIYVCEVLHRAGLSPKRQAACLARNDGRPSSRAEKLAPIISDVLTEAIAAGGSTLRDYASTDGTLGYFQHAFRVYGREDQACMTKGCPGSIRRISQAGRSTFYCGHCQR